MMNKLFFLHNADGVITYVNFFPNERIENDETLATGVMIDKMDFPENDESLGLPTYHYDGNVVTISYSPNIDPFASLLAKLADEKIKVVFLENELLIAKGVI